MNKILFRVDDKEAFINRENDYFFNKSYFVDANGFTIETMPLFDKSSLIICNDDRMLPYLSYNDAFELYLYNYKTGEYDEVTKAIPGLRRINNLESMWRRHVLEDCYYVDFNN